MVNPKDFFHKVVVIDASVLVKAFVEEDGSETVSEFLEMAKRYELSLVATPLLIFELLNTLSKKLKDPPKVNKMLKLFYKMNIGIFETNKDFSYIENAISKSCLHKEVSYYDASYHALAKQINGIFLTADQKYYKAVKDTKNIALFA